MKIIVGIVASENENYTEFKKVWLKNIVQVKNDPVLAELFDFYFLYSDSNGTSKKVMYTDTQELLYVDFYDKKDQFESVSHGILARTITFFNYMINVFGLTDNDSYLKHKEDGLFFVRTNLSTVFDFKLMGEWLKDKPKTNFFGGSFNGFYNGIDTIISGTNLIFSLDTIMYLTFNKDKIDMSIYLEDEAISKLIIKHLNIFIINVKRLDFIQMEEVRVSPDYIWPATPNSIIYHKAEIGDDDIFSFRFKTFNRYNDVIVMNRVVDELWKDDYNISNMVKNVSNMYDPPLPLSSEAPAYGKLYSNSPFKIFNLDFNEDTHNELTLKIE